MTYVCACALEQLEGRGLLSAAPLVPATDPRGKPDLIVDGAALGDWGGSTETFASDDAVVVEGTIGAGTHRLLRFTVSTPNVGAGSLIIGNPGDRPELFHFSPAHGHYHLDQYTDYRLWTPAGYAAWQSIKAANPDALSADLLAAHPEVATQSVGRKQGFCAIDVKKYQKDADHKTYKDCMTNQGISVGWADVYDRSLDGQWVETDGLAAGDYVLEVEVNAERIFEESNYRNNASAISVRVEAPKKQPRLTAFSTAPVAAPPARAAGSTVDLLSAWSDLLAW
jgi:hypothetical protein